MTAKQLHAAMEDRGFSSDLKTVRRDIAGLQQASIPIFESGKDETNAAIWKLDPSHNFLETLSLDKKELWSLYLSKSFTRLFKQAPFLKSAVTAFGKIEAKLDQRLRSHMTELEETLAFGNLPHATQGVSSEVQECIQTACAERHILEITYSRAGRVSTRLVGPHFKFFQGGAFYLYAEDLTDGKTRLFALARITAARMTETVYAKPALSPDALKTSFGSFVGDGTVTKVTLLAQPAAAQYIMERNFHDSQRLSEASDGMSEITFHLSLTPDFVSWIMGFGSAVKVMEPAELRERLVQAAEDILKRYQTKT